MKLPIGLKVEWEVCKVYKVKKTCNQFDVFQMIEGNDIYNSNFLYQLDNLLPENTFSTPYYKGRLDLAANEIYPVERYTYEGVLAIYNRLNMDYSMDIKDIKYPSSNDVRDAILD